MQESRHLSCCKHLVAGAKKSSILAQCYYLYHILSACYDLAVTSENGGKTNDQKLQTHRGQFFMLRGITSKNNDPNVHLGIGREKKRQAHIGS